jgi:hypothetical protein
LEALLEMIFSTKPLNFGERPLWRPLLELL